MSKDNLQEMYRIVNDIMKGDDPSRRAAYSEVRAAYIALLKDASVDFSKLPPHDLDVMNHYALRSHENFGVDLAVKGVSGIRGTIQAVDETVQFMTNPAAMAESAIALVMHPDDTLAQVKSMIANPWDTYKGNTMAQRLALAQQLESADSEFDLQTGQAKETAQSTINVLTTAAGAAGFVGKFPSMPLPPAGSVSATVDGFEFSFANAVAPAKTWTVPAAGVMAMADGSDKRDVVQTEPARLHARLTEHESRMMDAEQIELANACLHEIENAKTNSQQGKLRDAVAAYHAYVKDGIEASTSGPHNLSFSTTNQKTVSDKILLAAMNAPEGGRVAHTAKLRMQVGGLSSYLELAIVESPNTPPFVVAARPVISSENTLQAELGMTYEKISANTASQMVDEAEFVDWVTSYKTGPKDFKSALLQLDNPNRYISPVIKLEARGPIIDNEALLKNIEAPAGSRVLLTLNIDGVESGQSFTQLSVVLPPKELQNAQPSFVLLNASSSESGVSNGSELVRPAIYRQVSAQEILNMEIDKSQIESGGEIGQMLLRTVYKIANDQVSSISPVAEPKTLADAVSHLHPDAQAIVVGYVAAAQSQRDADKQQQQV